MSNPARVLIHLFEGWARTSPKSYRGSRAGEGPPEQATQFKLAVQLLAAIEARLKDLSEAADLDAARAASGWLSDSWSGLAKWWSFTLAIAAEVGSRERAREMKVPTDLSQCADLLDQNPQYGPTALEQLRSIARAARVALEQDTDLSPELRIFIHRLLSEIEAALDDEAVGATYDFASGAERLYMAFKAAESERTERCTTWRELWIAFLPGVTAAALVEGASLAIQSLSGP